MERNNIIYEESDRIATITINKEETMNSMDEKFVDDFNSLLNSCEKNDNLRVVIIVGAGAKAFTAGGDIKSERKFSSTQTKDYNNNGGKIILRIRNSRLIYIAAVNGYALGAGVSIVAACDLAFCSENAKFGIPTLSLGGIPGWGCTQIAKEIGTKNAKFMLLANEMIDAEEAKSIGLVNRVVNQNDLLLTTKAYAERIASLAPKVAYLAKHTINKGLDKSFENGLKMEATVLEECNSNYNFKEGISAFLEKRVPKYRSTI